MKIVISGGTGFIGRALVGLLRHEGHDVFILTRRAARHIPGVTVVRWDGSTRGSWERIVNGADALINLAGESIADRRWTRTRKQAIVDSRVGTTRLLVEACTTLSNAPRILINASAIGYYGSRGDELLSEPSEAGSGFLAELCREWEQAALEAESLGMRVIRLRTGMVLDRDGGALPRMMLPFRLFLGGPVAPGTQWVSWIHLDDVIRLIDWAIHTPSVTGAVNAVAPGAVQMHTFAAALGQALGRPSWLPIPTPALRLALGELSTLLTSGQRVQPAAALAHGFSFRYTSLLPALSNIAAHDATPA